MRPETLSLYAHLSKDRKTHGNYVDELATPHHIHFRSSLVDVADVAASQDPNQECPENAFPPAELACVTYEGAARCLCFLAVRSPEDAKAVCVIFMSWYGAIPIGAYRMGCNQVSLGTPDMCLTFKAMKESERLTDAMREMQLTRIAFLLSLANEPTRVEKTERALPRQTRRDALRKHGIAATGWTDVNWEVGRKLKKVRGQITDCCHSKALHYCRAHLRRARPSDPKSNFFRSPFTGEWGWYTKIAGCWRGHPDYGIKLQRHAPNLLGEKIVRADGPAIATIPENKLVAMSDVQRNAMVEAGYAPTAALQ